MEISSCFANLPIDPESVLLREKELRIKDIPLLIRQTFWAGITDLTAHLPAVAVNSMTDKDILDLLQVRDDQHSLPSVERDPLFVHVQLATALDTIAEEILDAHLERPPLPN